MLSVVDPVQVGRSAARLEELPRRGESILFGHQRRAMELRVPVAVLISDLALVVPAGTTTLRTGQSVLVGDRGVVGPPSKPDPQLRRHVGLRVGVDRYDPRLPRGPELIVEPSKLVKQLLLGRGDDVVPPPVGEHRPRHRLPPLDTSFGSEHMHIYPKLSDGRP